eukprot:m.135129 g.135129  ORF g.135129 m.135129 type:complete len:117 (-) comp16553_c0_seq6:3560-3910(-)
MDVTPSAAGAAPSLKRAVTGGADLPDFLSGVTIFIYNISNADMCRRLRRLTTAYGGSIDDYMSDKTTHVVSLDSWDRNFDEAKKEFPGLKFVRPSWIEACGKEQKNLSIEKHEIKP